MDRCKICGKDLDLYDDYSRVGKFYACNSHKGVVENAKPNIPGVCYNGISLWLDDIRRPPGNNWVWVTNFSDCITALSSLDVETISLDHDLGEYMNGYDVLKYIETKAMCGENVPSEIYIHTSNPVGAKRMLMAKESIDRFLSER